MSVRQLLILAALSAFAQIADPPQKLTKTEVLALQSLSERQRQLTEDSREFLTEVCATHHIPGGVDECQLDTQALTVSRKPKVELPQTGSGGPKK